jgi:hypothetical protein
MHKKRKLQELKDRFDRGDQRAAVRCLIECRQRGVPLPDWALDWHADGWERHGEGADLADAFFGPRLDGGRHASPLRKEIDQRRYEDAHAAVQAAVHCGCHGDQKFRVGARLYTSIHQNDPRTASQIEKIYERQNSRVNNGQMAYFLTPAGENVITCSGTLSQLLQQQPRW